MGLEAVKEEILDGAKQQANSLIAEARKEANRVTKEAERKIEKILEKSESEAKVMMDMIKRQELASAELENKKMLLAAKKEMIESVFNEARKKLESLNEKKKEVLVKKLLEKAKSEMEIGSVYCNKNDAKFLKDFSPETASILGGIMAENKERTIRIDYSFDSMLQSLKESELQNVSKALFV